MSGNQGPEHDRWMTTDEAMIYLGYTSRDALYKAVQRGHVPAHRIGPRVLRFKKSELDRRIQRN